MVHIYNPYWTYEKGLKQRNPMFDDYSKYILNLKHSDPASIHYFFNILESLANKEVALAVVPGHDPQQQRSGIHDLAKLMCNNGLWIDATDCLQRIIKIPKRAYGCNRSFRTHLDSIAVVNPEIIKGRPVFLLDDIRTTGNTMIACKMLLERAGARAVRPYPLSETRYVERNTNPIPMRGQVR